MSDRRDEIEPLLAQLVDDPDNASVLAVVGDMLESLGDPRGELIAMQLGIKRSTVEGAVEIARRREQLLESLTPVMPREIAGDQWTRDRFIWGTGYIRRLELGMRTVPPPRAAEALAALWVHESLRILSELVTTHAGGATLLATCPPPTVRNLELGRGTEDDTAALAPLLAGLPRLVRLRARGAVELVDFTHAGLATLELDVFPTWTRVDALVPAALPALRQLALAFISDGPELGSDPADLALRSLASAGWFAQLTDLTLRGAAPSAAAVAVLARALAGRKLVRLEIVAPPLPAALVGELAMLTDQLIAPSAGAAEPQFVEHTARPEWGRGTIVRRYDGKLEIEFPGAGKKVFKADAAFLRFG